MKRSSTIPAGLLSCSFLLFACGSLVQSPVTGAVQCTVSEAAGGAALAGAAVATMPATVSVVTDTLGNCTIQDVMPGRCIVTAIKYGYVAGSDTVDVAAGQTAPAAIQLASAWGAIRGRVTDSAAGDTALPGVKIWTSPATDSAMTDSLGYYLIRGLVPTFYTVFAFKSGYDVHVDTVHVPVGQTFTVDIRLQ